MDYAVLARRPLRDQARILELMAAEAEAAPSDAAPFHPDD
jgi:hypothetical protein